MQGSINIINQNRKKKNYHLKIKKKNYIGYISTSIFDNRVKSV